MLTLVLNHLYIQISELREYPNCSSNNESGNDTIFQAPSVTECCSKRVGRELHLICRTRVQTITSKEASLEK
jgi:hypothetical protein